MNSSSRRISIPLREHPYEIVIRNYGLDIIGNELLNLGLKKGVKILIVSNHDVFTPYGSVIKKSLRNCGFVIRELIIKAGENQKNQETIGLIHDAAYEAKLERGSLMIAFGGGVVGDMTGFAAATWLRGISVIQVPTTLLAMVDASIGGKTGINHPRGKNLIGAFHQPKLVLIDPKTLKSLPTREFRAGMAEVIKYGVINDSELFRLLEETPSLDDLNKIEDHLLEEVIYRSTASKSKVVLADEKEGGIRAILNYGHTFGHVIENLCGYGEWLHGEAVAMGMVAAGQLAFQKGLWEQSDAIRQMELIKKVGLPTSWPRLDHEKIFRSLEGDKKVKDGKIRFILPSDIGNVKIYDNVTKDEIRECLLSLS